MPFSISMLSAGALDDDACADFFRAVSVARVVADCLPRFFGGMDFVDAGQS